MDRAKIEALSQKLARAHGDDDADVIVEADPPDAVIFDLAPPLTLNIGRKASAHQKTCDP
jgi:hypothetical protein